MLFRNKDKPERFWKCFVDNEDICAKTHATNQTKSTTKVHSEAPTMPPHPHPPTCPQHAPHQPTRPSPPVYGFLQISNGFGWISCMWIRTYIFIIYKAFPESFRLILSRLVGASHKWIIGRMCFRNLLVLPGKAKMLCISPNKTMQNHAQRWICGAWCSQDPRMPKGAGASLSTRTTPWLPHPSSVRIVVLLLSHPETAHRSEIFLNYLWSCWSKV